MYAPLAGFVVGNLTAARAEKLPRVFPFHFLPPVLQNLVDLPAFLGHFFACVPFLEVGLGVYLTPE